MAAHKGGKNKSVKNKTKRTATKSKAAAGKSGKSKSVASKTRNAVKVTQRTAARKSTRPRTRALATASDNASRVAQVIKTWSKVPGKASPAFTNSSSLHELGLRALRQHVTAALKKVRGFKSDAFDSAWDANPPTTVGELLAKVADHTSNPPANYKNRVDQVIRDWSTPFGQQPPQLDDDTQLKDLNPQLGALRHDVAAEFENSAGFNSDEYFRAWDAKPPKTVSDVYAIVAKSF